MAKKPRKKKSVAVLEPRELPALHTFGGNRVVLDEDVAALFGVDTKRLNEQVTRNADKFGDDFAFYLTKEEFTDLRSQDATSKSQWGGRRHPPRAFTEHGVVMAATILKSPQAIQASRYVVQSFVAARQAALGKKKTKPGVQPALPLEMRTALMTKVNNAMGHVLDAMINPKEQHTVRDEAQAVVAESMKSLREYLKKRGHDNQKTIAEVRKLIAEAESIEIETAGKKTDNRMKELALLARQLKMVFEAQHYVETGRPDRLIQVLTDLENPPN